MALDLNFNNMTPAAPASAQNVVWQFDSNADISAYDPPFVGDSGSGGKAGNVPAPASGDAAAGKFLKADGTWSAPSAAATGPLPISNGGTGASSAAAALAALGGAPLSGANFTGGVSFAGGINGSPAIGGALTVGQSITQSTAGWTNTFAGPCVFSGGINGSPSFGGAISLTQGITQTNAGFASTFAGLLNANGGLTVHSAPPASSSAAGTAGQITWDANFLYVCVANGQWKRVSLTSF